MNTSEEAELTVSFCHIKRFSKFRSTDLLFGSPIHGWQKNENKNKNIGNCKALCVSLKRFKYLRVH